VNLDATARGVAEETPLPECSEEVHANRPTLDEGEVASQTRGEGISPLWSKLE